MSTDLPDDGDLDAAVSAPEEFIDDGVLYDEEVTPQYGILGFTLREVLIVVAWLIAFVVSFFPTAVDLSVWATGIQWILPIGLPTVAVFLIVLRRFSPDGIRRVGSLGIDQFASVAFSVAAVSWVSMLWSGISVLVATGTWWVSWTVIVQVVVSLGLVALTVFAPLVPGIKEDFHGRLVTLAHRNANPVRPVIARPVAEPAAVPAVTADADADAAMDAAPLVLDMELSGEQTTDEVARLDLAEHVPLSAHASGGGTGTEQTTADDEYVPTYSRRSRAAAIADAEIVSDTASIEELVLPASDAIDETEGELDADIEDAGVSADEPDVATTVHEVIAEPESDLDDTNPRDDGPVAQPFWILAPTERDVHDERGETIFRIGPTAWALVIEDRGGAFVVRHDDGRIGYLHDIADITKG